MLWKFSAYHHLKRERCWLYLTNFLLLQIKLLWVQSMHKLPCELQTAKFVTLSRMCNPKNYVLMNLTVDRKLASLSECFPTALKFTNIRFLFFMDVLVLLHVLLQFKAFEADIANKWSGTGMGHHVASKWVQLSVWYVAPLYFTREWFFLHPLSFIFNKC